MGGKGRGVFSDFRLGRVCPIAPDEQIKAKLLAVPIQSERPCWKPARREEGELVDTDGLSGGCWTMCIILRHEDMALGGVQLSCIWIESS